jgi:hypothetical protein
MYCLIFAFKKLEAFLIDYVEIKYKVLQLLKFIKKSLKIIFWFQL